MIIVRVVIPPSPPWKGGNQKLLKVPLFKGDLGGSPIQPMTDQTNLQTPQDKIMQTIHSPQNSMVSTTKSPTSNYTSNDFLTFQNVKKSFPTPGGEYVVLEGVDLTIKQGEFICIIGHSGCGKSTLLNMVSGFSQPTDGSVKLKGQAITRPGPDRMVVFQGYALLPWLSVYDNVYLAVNAVNPTMPQGEKDEIVKKHLQMVGLTEAMDKTPPQISGGMRQRVAIARALSIRPEVLVLDEPFGALDAITKEELQEELLKIWNNTRNTVLMITHDIDEALFLADRLVMMTNGPSAKIGEVIDIPFKRPRDRSRIMEMPEYYKIRNYVLDYLYNRFAHDVD
jgi:bicarbonate transport system ATP-binding protein